MVCNILLFKIKTIRKLENELHLMASYFIAKEKETFDTKINEHRRKLRSDPNFNLNDYSHQNVDRFAILLDIWTNEVNFLEMKKTVK